MKTIAAFATDRGKVREYQQDRVLLLPNHGVYVLADGMGGMVGGDKAAERATNGPMWEGLLNRGKSVSSIIDEANYHIKNELLGSGGTTIVVAEERPDDKFRIYWVGDSRAYKHYPGKALLKLTTDHSTSSRLTRALGAPNAQADIQDIKFEVGHVLLLCSDGLTNMLNDEQILEVMNSCNYVPGAYELKEETDRMRPILLAKMAEQLVAEANLAGGRDNVSVVLVQRVE